MATLWQDIRYACRMLARNPGFTAVAVLTLALGIGANLALFGVLNELLLRPKPVARPHELWAIGPADAAGQPTRANLCRPYYEAIRREIRVFQGIIGCASIKPKLRVADDVERISAELVSGDYFSFLGVVPVLGRGFLPEEDARAGARAVAVISHAFWQNRFGGTPDVLGKTITLNNTLVEIVGVAPRGFAGLGFQSPSLWMPASMEPVFGELTIYDLVGRLTDPRLAVTAADLLTPIAAEVTKELLGSKDPRWSRYGVWQDFRRIRLDPIGRGLLGTSYLKSRILGFLRFAGVATVLLLFIASANVASLFLARALQRRKETATRVALGATRTALVWQVICEGVLVAAGGTVGALLAFSWVGGTIMRFASWWPGPPLRPALDVRVLLFAAGGALAVGVAFSILPALQATRFEPFTALRDIEGAGRRRLWLRQGLIVAQVVGSFVLLCGATLCLRMANQFRFVLSVTLGIVALVLVIACCNVASTMLARGTYQGREFALRAMLGATRGRIVQQVLAESLVLSVAGSLPGVLLGYYALEVLLRLLGSLIPTWMKFSLDIHCLVFCVLIVAATTVLSGLLPALHAAAPKDLQGALQAVGARATGSRAKRRTPDAIIAAQVALAMTLLVGAGLILRTYLKVQDIDPGFRTAGVLTYNVPLPIGAYLDENKRHAFWDQYIEKVQALPGVVHAALINVPPMSHPGSKRFEAEGAPPKAGNARNPDALTWRITPDYFAAVGIPLLAGRGLVESDNRRDSERTAVIDETFARRFWPHENPIDKLVWPEGSQDWIRVIGMVKDTKQISLEQVPQPTIYLPRVTDAAYGMCAVVQTSGDPLSLVPAIRASMQSIDPGPPIEDVRTLAERVYESMSGRRLALWMYGIPALVAAILAFAGIYGVTSYAASQRTQEIGIRVALGARVPDVIRTVIGRGLRLISIGLALGSLGAIALSRVLASTEFMLYDVSPADPLTWAGVPVFLIATSILACYIPAHRAARVDPMVALRHE